MQDITSSWNHALLHFTTASMCNATHRCDHCLQLSPCYIILARWCIRGIRQLQITHTMPWWLLHILANHFKKRSYRLRDSFSARKQRRVFFCSSFLFASAMCWFCGDVKEGLSTHFLALFVARSSCTLLEKKGGGCAPPPTYLVVFALASHEQAVTIGRHTAPVVAGSNFRGLTGTAPPTWPTYPINVLPVFSRHNFRHRHLMSSYRCWNWTHWI